MWPHVDRLVDVVICVFLGGIMLVRSVDPGGAVAQQSIISQQQAQILRTGRLGLLKWSQRIEK